MKFKPLLNLDNFQTKKDFLDGKIKLQKGNWIKYHNIKGRIMGKSVKRKEGNDRYNLVAVFPVDEFDFVLDGYHDFREILQPFVGQTLVFSFEKVKKQQSRVVLEKLKHSWGEVVTNHLILPLKQFSLIKENTKSFFGEIYQYPDAPYRFGIKVKKEKIE